MSKCSIATDSVGRFINVRSDYSGGFVAEARSAGGYWDRTCRVWTFDTHSGITLDHVTQICRRHYQDVTLYPYGQKQGVAVTSAPTPDAGHVGTEGQRLTLLVQVTKIFDRDGQYGTTRFTIMRDDVGHVFTWRASNERLDVGDRVTIMGSVKRHDTYRGVSQTVLTRCKVVAKHGNGPVGALNPSVAPPAPKALEWWEQPWACGHKDPVFVNPHTQRCAICHEERHDPNGPLAHVQIAALGEDPTKVKVCSLHGDYYGIECPYCTSPMNKQLSLAEEVGF